MNTTAAYGSDIRARGLTALWACAAVAFFFMSLVTGVLAGPIDLDAGHVLESTAARLHIPGFSSPLSPTEEAILWHIRVPRVVLAALVGGMLSLAGATYQGVFRNPLADPYLLGVAAGAGLGATVAISYGPIGADGYLLPLAAFAGALLAVVAAYAIGRSLGGERTTATLILAGVTVAAFLTAAQTFVQQQNTETLNEVYAWLLGVGFATLGTAAAVAVSGLIGFVGIVVPHLVRLVVAPAYRVILPLSLA